MQPSVRNNRWSRLIRFQFGVAAAYFGVLTAAGYISVTTLSDAVNWLPEQVPEVFIIMYSHGAALLFCTALWLSARRMPFRTGRLARWGMAILMLLFFGSLDRILGVFYPPTLIQGSVHEPHPVRGWALKPRIEGPAGSPGASARINAMGLRGPEIPKSKPANERRIMFLGDSVTFGYSVNAGDTLPEQVETRLAAQPESGVRFRCVNAGVSGYTTWQELNLLREFHDRVRPDVVILQFCINDVKDILYAEEGRLEAAPMVTIGTGSDHWSGIYRAIQSISWEYQNRNWQDWHIWGRAVGTRGPNDIRHTDTAFYTKTLLPEVAVAWDRTYADLERFRKFCRDRGTHFIILYIPIIPQLNEDPSGPQPQDRVAQWCLSKDVDFVDVTPQFREIVDAGVPIRPKYMKDAVHPVGPGYAIAADAVVEYLKQNSSRWRGSESN